MKHLNSLLLVAFIGLVASNANATDYNAKINFLWKLNQCNSELSNAIDFTVDTLSKNQDHFGIKEFVDVRAQGYGVPGSFSVIPVSENNSASCSRINFASGGSRDRPGHLMAAGEYKCNSKTNFLIIKVGRSIPGTGNGFHNECIVIKI